MFAPEQEEVDRKMGDRKMKKEKESSRKRACVVGMSGKCWLP
jgi:hypothetical protein